MIVGFSYFFENIVKNLIDCVYITVLNTIYNIESMKFVSSNKDRYF